MYSRPFAFFFVVATFTASSRADDANWSTFGGAGAFTPNRHVRMEREDVRISLDDKTVQVHATFWFRNQGAATTVRMGFPDETVENGALTKPPIRRFRSQVDGKPVRVTHEVMARSHDFLTELRTYRSAWVKTVTFQRDGTRRVEVWYEAARGEMSGMTKDTYIFKTGSTWRGTIGLIETTVDWTKSRQYSRPALSLTGPAPGAIWTDVGRRRAKLTVRDVKPRFDLDLESVEGFWNFRLNGRILPPKTASDDSGPVIEGPPSDLRISVAGLGTLFDEVARPGSTDAGDTVWRTPEVRRFGGTLKLVGAQTLETGDGRKLLLAHPATNAAGRPFTAAMRANEEAPYIRLHDLFVTIGGAYRYRPEHERVDLTLPGTPRAKAGH